ncbi:cadherin-like domain-containing protein [Paracoccus actinidiae]|uniref:cadherin-like domain-containing protein n=1 Tax=Paracoccus actinidiae TaxID=3064531 RepID=UPI0027D311DE|nr:cadherin-like domain-containing protein [Paracoccus sp. M09]
MPTADHNGAITLSYDVLDGNGGTIAASQSLALAAVNDAPIAITDAFGGVGSAKIFEQSEIVIDVHSLLANDFDVEGDEFHFAGIGSLPGNGTASVVTEDGSTYIAYTYTGPALAENATATDSLAYLIRDSHGATSAGKINLTVTGLANKVISGTNGGDNGVSALVGSNSANDTIHGLNGDDALNGRGGNDKLFGGNGIDHLFGGDGADTLDGGRGDDVLNAGRGNDILTGGLGADVFDFSIADSGSTNSGHDTITDFKLGTDDITLGAGDTFKAIAIGHHDSDNKLDTILSVSNGGSIKILGVADLDLAGWSLLAG